MHQDQTIVWVGLKSMYRISLGLNKLINITVSALKTDKFLEDTKTSYLWACRWVFFFFQHFVKGGTNSTSLPPQPATRLFFLSTSYMEILKIPLLWWIFWGKISLARKSNRKVQMCLKKKKIGYPKLVWLLLWGITFFYKLPFKTF